MTIGLYISGTARQGALNPKVTFEQGCTRTDWEIMGLPTYYGVVGHGRFRTTIAFAQLFVILLGYI